MNKTPVAIAAAFLLTFFASLSFSQPPELMLAKPYRQGLEISDYLVSEKLDGVRARWDGEKLISRGGKVFAAPPWFSENFPDTILDGELWSERGAYQTIASITARQQPHAGWRSLHFMVFDLPASSRQFSARARSIRRLVEQTDSDYLQAVQQFEISDEAALMSRLQQVIDAGGEGLMLHAKAAQYRSGRSGDLLKLKVWQDAEGVLIGYRPGKGKYTGQVGALQLQMPNGKTFYVGSGLRDALRRQPPPIGGLVSYRFQGFTDSGLPRFPVFLRVRNELDNPEVLPATAPVAK